MNAPPAPRTFSPVVVLWMVLVGVVSFGAWSVLSVYAPDLREPTDGGAHALSKSALGFVGLRELLTARGDTVIVSRGQGRRAPGLLILTPGEGTDDKAAAVLLEGDGPVLVVLPKWLAAPDPTHPGWVQRVDLIPPAALSKGLPRSLAGGLVLARRKDARPVTLRAESEPFAAETRLQTDRIENLQSARGEGWSPVLVDDRGDAILLKAAEREEYVLTDPDLFDTHGLAGLKTATAAVAMLDALRPEGGAIVQDVTLNGFKRSRNPLKLAFEPPFLGMTLAALAAVLLMGGHAAVRFGPTRRGGRALALGARALADNSAGLIRLAGREPRMAPAYAALVRAQVARAVAAPRELSGEALDAFLDRIGLARGLTERSGDLTAAAASVRTRAELMQLAHRLDQWKTEISRDRR